MDANQLLVIDVQGSAGIIQADGSIKALSVGDVITVGDTVITADKSTLLIDVQGESLSIPANKKVTITPDLLAKEVKDSSENTVFDDSIDDAIASLNQPNQAAPDPQQGGDISDFLDALEGGGDILDSLEATAAGGTGGATSGGGTSFVELARIAEGIDPSSLAFDDSFNSDSSGIFSPRDTTDGVVPTDTLTATVSIDDPGVINNSQPVITGTTENLVGETITVTVTDVNGNNQVVTVVVQPDGTFTTPPLDPLPDGPIVIEVVAIDPNGDPVSDTIGANIDTIAPVVTINELPDSASQTVVINGSVSGISAGDDVTITVTDSAGQVQTFVTQVDEQGNWSITTEALAEGLYTVLASAVDAAGNEGTDTENGLVDLTAPVINIDPIGETNDTTPTISGNVSGVTVGSEITVVITAADGAIQTVIAIVADDGSWTIDVPVALVEGEFTVTATVLDAAGNEAQASTTGIIDVTAPIINITPIDDTQDTTPTITGNVVGVVEGSVVTVVVTDINGQVQTLTALTDANGNWTLDVPSELAEGSFEVTATVSDLAGNQAQDSATGVIDLTPPDITLTAIANTNDTTPVFVGRVEGVPEGTQVTIQVVGSDGQSQSLTAFVLADGSYSVEASTALPEGSFTAIATVSDPAGNSATANTSGTVAFSPISITIDSIADSNDTTPLLSGQTEGVAPGTTIMLSVTASDGSVFNLLAITQADGSWSIQMTQPLPEGDFTVVATVLDPQGNEAQATAIGNVDLTVSINFIIDTNDTTPSVSGSTQDVAPGAVVTVTFIGSDGATETIQVITDANGDWSVEATIPLVEGQFTVTATVTDEVGNTATASEIGEIDLTDPTIFIDPLNDTNDTTPTISGSVLDVPAGTTVSLLVTDSNGVTQTLTATTDAQGNWQVDVASELAEGDYTVTASVSDEAGNTSTATATGTIDLTAPIINIDTMADSNDTTPTISGTTQGLDAATTVTVSVTDSAGSTQTFTTITNADGSWSVTVTDELAEGEFTVVAQTQDKAGNSAEDTETGVIDLTAPSIAINEFTDSNDVTPVISGVVSGVEPGTLVTITLVDSNGNQQVLTAVVNADNTWQVGANQVLAEGEFTITATVSDPAGNQALDTATGVIDLTAPIIALDFLGSSADNTPTITGTVQGVNAGTTVTLVVTDSNGNSQTFTALTNSAGGFSADVPNGLAEGEYTVTASVADEAGNQALDTATGNIDLTAPIIDLDPLGSSADNTPTITGTVQGVNAGTTVTLVVTDSNGNSQTFTAVTNSNGGFSADVPTSLAEGEYTVTASVADDAGNQASDTETGQIDSSSLTILIDAVGETNDITPTISGSTLNATAGDQITVVITPESGVAQTFTTQVDANGNWTITVSQALAEGEFTVDATLTDQFGNTANDSIIGVIDITAPSVTIDTIGSINDSTPVISGTSQGAVNGSTVTVTVVDSQNNSQVYTTTVDANGNWSVPVTSAVAQGQFTVTASITDNAGNTGTDTEIGNFDGVGPLLTLDFDPLTNDTTPLISGTTDAVAGTVVSVVVTDSNGATQTLSAVVAADGTWSISPDTPLAEGAFTVTASVADESGNQTQITDTGVIDITAPTISIDNLGTVNDTTPTISGQTNEPAGSIVTVVVTDGVASYEFTAIVNADGSWSGDVPAQLEDGNISVTATVTDAAGNSAQANSAFILNSSAPSIAIDAINDTNDTTPTISGTSDAPDGTLITVIIEDSDNNSQSLTATVQNGVWSVEPTQALSEGSFTVSASVTVDGLTSDASAQGLIDITPPTVTIDALADTSDVTPLISGQTSGLVSGSIVTVTITDSNGDSQVVSATVAQDGSWSVAASTDLAEGQYTVTAVVADSAGNQATDTETGIIDLTAPTISIDNIADTNDVTPVLSGQTTGVPAGSQITLLVTDSNGNTQTLITTTLADGSWSVEADVIIAEGAFTVEATVSDAAGNTATDTATGVVDTTAPTITVDALAPSSDVTPVISGMAEGVPAGTVVSIVITDSQGVQQSLFATVNNDGSWSVEALDAVAEGEYTVVATVQDAAGNQGTDTETGLIDTTAPTVVIDPQAVTNDTTPVISGQTSGVPTGTEVRLTITDSAGNVQTLVATTGADGSWSVAVSQALAQGSYTIDAEVSDAAGNTGNDTASGEVDITAPVVSIDEIADSNDVTPVISGQSTGVPAGTLVTLTITDSAGNVQTVTTTVQADGSWSAEAATALAEGDYTVVATIVDAAGNTGSDTETGTIDVTAPTITIDAPALTNDNTPTVTGSSDLANTNFDVTFTDANGTSHTVTVTTDASGNWSVDAAQALADGNYSVTASISDSAGNNSSATDSGVVDTIPPELAFVPTFLLGQLVTLSGTSDLPAGSTVTITQNLVGGGVVTYTATTDANGDWSLTGLTVPLLSLASITASASDEAGNVRTITSTDFDGTPPTLTVSVDALTNDNTPLISGTTDAGEGAQVSVVVTDANGATETLTAIVDANGNWSVSPTTALADGQFSVEASVRDGVGNLSEETVTGVIDTLAPTLTLTGVGEGSDVTPVLSGTSNEIGATVTISVTDSNGTVQTFTAIVGSNGTWSREVPNGLAEGDYTVTVTVSDDAGNTSSVTATGNIDTTNPVVTVNDNGLGNDDTPTLSGTSTEAAGTLVSIIVIDSNGDTHNFTATVAADGSWQTDASVLPDGDYTITATITDGAGNVGTDSGTGRIDTTPPLLTINNLGTVNTDTPTISGTSSEPAGTVISLVVTDSSGNTLNLSAVVDGNGDWSVTSPSLTNDNYTVVATVEDAAGNTATASESFTLDTSAPSIAIDVIGETNDPTPTITGTTDAADGSTVTVVIDDGVNPVETLTTTVTGGVWFVTANNALPEGSFTVTATVTVNTIDGTATRTGTVDLTAPSITINDINDTNDTTPTISGTTDASAGSLVTLTITDSLGNTQTVVATVLANGSWSVAASTILAEGTFTVTASVTDAAGNTGTDNATGNVDITAPVVSIDAIADSNDVTPVISGQSTGVPAGTLVTLTITDSAGNVQTVTTTVQADGSWSAEAATALAEGDYTVVATIVDAAGNTGSDTETGTIDVTAPTITIDAPALTNDNTPTVTGSSDLANTNFDVTFTDANGTSHTVTVTTDASGNWSVDAAQALADGNYSVTASISDSAGNNSSATDSGVVDTIPPELAFVPTFLLGQLVTLSGTSDLPAGSTVTITQNLVGGGVVTYTATTDANGDWSLTGLTVPLLSLASITASASDEAGNVRTITSTDFDGTPPTLTVSVDALTNDNTPLISGTTDAGEGAQVSVVVTDANGATETLTAIVDANGNWSVSPTTALADGQFSVEASVRDGVGNLSEETVTGVIDTLAPTLTLTGVGEGSDVTPVLSGRSNEVGGTVTVTVTDSNGAEQTLTATVNSSGDWSVEVPTALAEGSYTVAVTISDDAGNTSNVTATGNIDTTNPVVTVNDNGLGNDSTPTLSGTSTEPAGTVVNLSIVDSNGDSHSLTATVLADGSWQATSSSLPDGAYTVTATITDAAGNVGTDTGTGSIDTLPPSLAIDSLGTVNDTTPTISGTSNEPAGSVVNLSVSDGTNTYTFTATVLADGTWSADVPSPLDNGTFTIDASITDAAGNATTASDSALLDTTAPSITINVIGETNDTTPTINGTSDAENGSVVTVVIDDGINPVETITTTVSGGTWSVTPTTALPEGEFTVTASVLENGNTGTATRTGIIDTTMPAIDINELGITNDTTPTISGTASAPQGSTVTVVITDANNNSHTVTTTMQSDGSWSVAASTILAEGEYTVTATVSDQAGNPASASATGEVDITAPVVSIDAIADSNDVTPVISGQSSGAAAGSQVLLTVTDSDGATQSATAIVQADGSWSVELSSALAEGNYTVVATIVDAAGNTGSDTETGTIDVTAPTITIDAPALTNDNTPTVTGSSDLANTNFDVTFTDANGTSHTVTVTTDASGNWSVDAAQALADGNYSVTASISDSAGNNSSATDSGVVDTIAPDIRIIPSFLLGNLVGLSGTSDLPEGSVITITEHLVGGLIGATYTATTDANGNWTLANITVPLISLAYVTASGTDAAGNTATVSTLEFDNVAPELTVTVDALTNDTTPTISGTTDMGEGTVINITVQDANGDSQTFTATVQSNQTWSVDVPTALAEGTFTVTASVRDQVGNLTTEQTSGVLDSIAPTLVVNAVDGTSDARPTISGSSNEIGGLVIVEVAGQTITTTVASDGTWQFIVPVDITDGSYTITATITDDANNTQTATASITVDTVAPVVAIDTLGLGNSSTPVISGTSTEATGTQVSVTVTDSNNDIQTLTATVQSDGSWQVTPSTMPDGNYSVTATITDVAGNVGTDTETGSIDTLTPELVLGGLGTINDSTPTISGSTNEPAGSTVNISVVNDGNTYSFTATVQADGSWSADVPTALADGLLTITATITDAANNTATVTDTATLDTNAPTISIDALAVTNDTTPTISGTSDAADGIQVTITVVDALGNSQTAIATISSGAWTVDLTTPLSEGNYTVTASVSEDGLTGTASRQGGIDLTPPALTVDSPAITNDTTPTISGTSDAPQGSVVTISVTDSAGDIVTASAVVGASGAWSVALGTALAEGAYTISASVSDTAGNTSSASASGVIDITPANVVIDTVAVSTDLTPVIMGSATGAVAGNRVVVTFVDSAGVSHSVETTLDASLNWQVEATQALAEGAYTVTAVVTDTAGNNGSASTTSAVDTTAPVVSIDQSSLTLTNDSTPLISGTSDAANSTITVTFIAAGGAQHSVTTTTDANGDWQAAADQVLADGVYSVTASITDTAGNTGTDSKTGGEVDTVAPELTIVPSFLLGLLVSLSGTSDLPEGSVITITNYLVGGVAGVPYTATVDANGDWQVLNLSVSLLNLAYVEATATDAAGNTTTISTDTFDNSAPELTLDVPAISADTTPVISGTSTVGTGQTVTLIVQGADGASQTLTTLVNSNGTWSVEVLSELVDGTYTVTASVTDAEDRTTEQTASGIIDAGLTITIDDGLQLTNDDTPLITGKSIAPNSEIEVVFDNGITQQTKTVTSLSDGTWSVTPDSALVDGTYTVTATIVSSGVTTGAISGLEIDTIPPTLENIDVNSLLNLGLVITGFDGTTDAEDGAIVQLDNALALGITLLSEGGSVVQNGQWSIDIVDIDLLDILGLGLADARFSITDSIGNVRVVDINGNDIEINGEPASTGGAGPEEMALGSDSIEADEQTAESIDLSLVLLDASPEPTSSGGIAALDVTIEDVLSDSEQSNLLALDSNSESQSLAFTGNSEVTSEPASNIQSESDELIKKLIEGGNNSIDI